MAQARVSDFFGTKKRSQETHPSKKRKIDPAHLESKTVVTNEATVSFGKSIDAAPAQSGSKPNGKTPGSNSKRKPKATTSTTLRTRVSARKKHALIGQVKIQDAFAKVSGSSSDNDSQGVLSDAHAEPTEITEVTSYWDEHDGPQTPKHKIRPSESVETPLSDCRETTSSSTRRPRKATRRTLVDDCVTPKKDVKREEEKAIRGRSLALSFRKMVEATPTGSADLGQKGSEEGSSIAATEPVPSSKTDERRSVPEKSRPSGQPDSVALPSEEDLAQLKPTHPVPISPLPPTPQGRHLSKKTAPVVSSKIRSSAEKLKELQKDDSADQKADDGKGEMPQKAGSQKSSKKVISPGEMRERLAKCGKLDTLKAKLAEMNSSLKAVQKREAETAVAEAEVEPGTSTEKKAAPAFERYEHLAREGPPALALPGKYQRLLTMFQGTDTVVSMLFNRQETITFSKLKNAVQSMTKKTFEQKALGQMKTVYPDAYVFRQEKGLSCFGNKVSGYQLIVEPDLEGFSDEGLRVDKKKENATMSPQVLLKRKRIFHNSLISITQDHHATFLSKMNPRIQVPPSKLTRWHPRFSLDTVPDVETAELPAAPEQKVQTAQQVLDKVRGKLPDRVQQALAQVAMKSEGSQPKPGPSRDKEQQSKNTTASTTASKPVSAALKGIPLALLEKIRAKEAARTQAHLTRDPKEDRKTEMIGRLPILIRSLRTFYITEKKPSLLYGTVVEKLADSYETSISQAEVAAHLVLLQKLAPKWIQVIEIPRGKYVRIDKNMDISVIIADLNNLAKSRR